MEIVNIEGIPRKLPNSIVWRGKLRTKKGYQTGGVKNKNCKIVILSLLVRNNKNKKKTMESMNNPGNTELNI
jgi:hypothetical protein